MLWSVDCETMMTIARRFIAAISFLTVLAVANSQRPVKCFLAVSDGNCSDNVDRWYFDNSTGLCQRFTYTGCAGNDNNFNSSAYCYHACNGSTDGAHMYSIENSAEKLKGKNNDNSRQAVNSGSVTAATNFNGRVQSTRTPTLIRASGQSRDRQTGSDVRDNQQQPTRRRRRAAERRRVTKSNEVDGVKPEVDDEYDRRKYRSDDVRRRLTKTKRYPDSDSPNFRRTLDPMYGPVESDFYFRSGSRDLGIPPQAFADLLGQMQHTAALLERFVLAATAPRPEVLSRRRPPTPKNADAEPEVDIENDERQFAPEIDKLDRRADSLPKRRGRGRSLLHVTLLGRLRPLPAGRRRSLKPEVESTSPRKQSTVDDPASELPTSGDPQPRQLPSKTEPADGDDNDDVSVIGDHIRSVIEDPEEAFSYSDITADDMSALEEVASQADAFGSMRLVDKDDNDPVQKGDSKPEVELEKSPASSPDSTAEKLKSRDQSAEQKTAEGDQAQ